MNKKLVSHFRTNLIITREHSRSANLHQGQSVMGDSFSQGNIVSCFDLETFSKVINDGAVGQNTHDFLLAFYGKFGRISYRFCATVDFVPK